MGTDMTEIIQTAFQILCNVFVVLNTILVLKFVYGRDMRCDAKTLAVTGVTFLLADVLLTLIVSEEYRWVAEISIYVFLFSAVLFMARSRRVVTLILVIPAILFYIQTASIFLTLEMLADLERIHTITADGKMITPMYVLCDPLCFVILLFLIRHTDKRIQITSLGGIEVIILMIFSAVAYYAAGVIQTIKGTNNFHFVLAVLILLAFEILILYAIYHRKRSGYYRRLSQEYKKQFETEYNFFKDYKATQEDTIRFRHDWKNHMLLLREMLAKGDYSKAENYFGKLSENTPEGVKHLATGNELADMIIGIKSEQMEEEDIVLHFKGNLKELNVMEHVDCCILLSNLTDNAIEANKKIKDSRYIAIMSRKTENHFYMEMRNPFADELQKDGERIISTKKSKIPHGIGLENIKAIVQKYQGECRIIAENGEFVFQMLLPTE